GRDLPRHLVHRRRRPQRRRAGAAIDGVFFFSSRRRHTRSKRDWSSDVCSSDLSRVARWRTGLPEFDFVLGGGIVPGSVVLVGGEIGRASCRERVEVGEVDVVARVRGTQTSLTEAALDLGAGGCGTYRCVPSLSW